MTRMTTTNQKKNTTIAGIAYPPTVLALATAFSYPAPPGLSARASALNLDFRGAVRGQAWRVVVEEEPGYEIAARAGTRLLEDRLQVVLHRVRR